MPSAGGSGAHSPPGATLTVFCMDAIPTWAPAVPTFLAFHSYTPLPTAAPALSGPRLLELLRDGSDLLHAVLVGSQVALKGLMLLEQGLDLREGGGLIVLLL